MKTLRDEFAMAALMGMLADPGSGAHTEKRLALAAYAYADAMMVARGPDREPGMIPPPPATKASQ